MFGKKRVFSDQEIIHNIKVGGGERERMTHYLAETYERKLVGRGRKQYHFTEEQAKDVHVDAIAALIDQIKSGRFRGDCSISTYLYTIHSRECTDKIRTMNTEKNKSWEWATLFTEIPDSSQNFLKRFMQRDEMIHIGNLLKQLSENCKELIWGAHYDGYSYEELANKMDYKSAGVVGVQKNRCMERLRELIRRSGEYEG